MEETFNVKCDRILKYLSERNKDYTSWEKFSDDTQINKNDNSIQFLRTKKFIENTISDIYISPNGVEFISNNSFCKIQQESELNSALLWYNREDAKQIFDDYPIIKRQKRNAYIFAAITLFLIIISTWIAVAQYIKCK